MRSMDCVIFLWAGEVVSRVPGTGVVFSDTVSEAPPVFIHMMNNLPAIYETIILLTVRWDSQYTL